LARTPGNCLVIPFNSRIGGIFSPFWDMISKRLFSKTSFFVKIFFQYDRLKTGSLKND